MIYDTAIYGGQDDPQSPQIVYVDRTVEVYVGGGGGGIEEYVGNNIQEVEKIIYKDPVFPKLKVRRMESHNQRIQINVTRVSVEDI